MSETDLQRAIQEALSWLPGVVVWRCNAGMATEGKRRVCYGLRNLQGKVAGTPDLIGLVDGRFLALEVKLPGKKPTPDQRKRLDEVSANGGIAAVVRSVNEALLIVNGAKAKRWA